MNDAVGIILAQLGQIGCYDQKVTALSLDFLLLQSYVKQTYYMVGTGNTFLAYFLVDNGNVVIKNNWKQELYGHKGYFVTTLCGVL